MTSATRFTLFLAAFLAANLCTVAAAQVATPGEPEEDVSAPKPQRLEIQPYVEVDQIASWQLEPGDDLATYTRLAAGVDAAVRGRSNGGSLSLRYERNFAWDRNARDSDTISGVARGYATIVPNAVMFDAGALAARTRIDGSSGPIVSPILGDDLSTQTYALYAGPRLQTRLGAADVTGHYRLGYTRVDGPDFAVPGGAFAGGFDESLSHSAALRAATRPGDPLPVGLGLGGGLYREDINNLDQRVHDSYVRGDVTIPVTRYLWAVAGVGVEDVEVSNRDALRDAAGNPIIAANGRYVTDPASPRKVSFAAEGLIWDVGAIWRPSRRTSLEAHYGRRYDDQTIYGTFAWQPTRRSNLAVSVYDGLQGFGGRVTNSLALLPSDFEIIRDPVTGEIIGCTDAVNGVSCLDQLLGSARSAVFRGRGVTASFSERLGRMTASIAGGYDRRRFIAAEDTVLAGANGVVDENYFLAAQLAGPVGRNARFTVGSFANWYEPGRGGFDAFAVGASASYTRQVWRNLSARAAVSLTSLDSDRFGGDVSNATALVGLRYEF